MPSMRLKGKEYMKAGLVIIDEVGFETFTREEADFALLPRAGEAIVTSVGRRASPRTRPLRTGRTCWWAMR